MVFFNKLDTDSSGYIEKQELMNAFPQLDEAAALLMVLEADANRD